MRCKACNVILDDSELTKKDSNNDFIDMCGTCLNASGAIEVDSDNTFVKNYQDDYFTEDDNYDTLF